MKRRIFWRAIALCTLLIGICTLPSSAQEIFQRENHIQVTGRAEREITPNEFWLAITLQESDSKGKITIDEQVKAIHSVLKRIGIDPQKALRLANSTNSFHKKGENRATAHYELRTNSIAEMHAAWQALDQLALSEVRLLKAVYTQLEELSRELRREAILNARDCAQQLAEALGQKAGACFYIVDWNNNLAATFELDNAINLTYRSKQAVSEETIEEAENPQPEFRTRKVSYQVQAKFVLE